MTTLSLNPISVIKDGVTTRLDTLAYNISTRKGIVHMAGLRTTGEVVPGRHGRPYVPGQRRETGKILLNMWAQDKDVNGAPGADPYVVWRSNMDKLLRIFDTTFQQVTIVEQLSGTDIRYADCEVTSAIDPDYLGRAFGKFIVELEINNTFWTNDTDLEWSSATGTGANAAGALQNITTFAGATAPMEDYLILVDGPWTSPEIVDGVTGHSLKYNGTLANGRQWLIDTTLWNSLEGPNTMGYTGTGGTSVITSTISSGYYSPRLFGLTPRDPNPQLKLLGSGLGAASRVRVKGRKKFH